MANAADIIVNLVARTARFDRGVRRANRHLGTMAKAARTAQFAMRTLGTAIIGLAAGRAAAAIRTQIAFAGNLQRVAETVGFTTSQVQELRFAAEQLNLSQKTLDLGLQRFSRRLGEAAEGTGELLKTAEKYGVVLRDSEGNIRDNASLLGDFAEIIANTTDEQEQLRIAFKLFDSEGAGLVRLLRGGRRALQDYSREANRLGIVVEDALVDKAAEADRQLNLLSQVLRARVLTAVAENIEEIAAFATGVSNLAVEVVELTAAMVDLGRDGVGFLKNVDQQIKLERLASEMEGLEATMNQRPTAGGFLDVLQNGMFAPLVARDELRVLHREFSDVLQDIADDVNRRVAEARARANAITPTISSPTGTAATVSVAGEVSEVDISDALIRVNRVMQDRARLAQLVEASRTREARILSDIRFVTEAIHNGEGNVNQLLEVRAGLFDQLREAMDKGLEQATVLEEISVQAFRNMQTALSDFIAGSAGGFDDLLKNFRDMLIRMVAELLARRILLDFLGGLAGGSGGLSKFAKGLIGSLETRHTGGRVNPGTPVITGGPGAEELFIPDRSGVISPIANGGDSLMINVPVTFNGQPSAEAAVMIQQGVAQAVEIAVGRMYQLRNKRRF